MKRGLSGDQILGWEGERAERLILGSYLAQGESLLLYAPTGQGKTVNALMLGIALSTGGTFYDWKAKAPMQVLFVEGGELTAHGIAERMKAIYKRQGITEDPNFHLLAPTPTQPEVFDITDPDHQATLFKYIDQFNIGCVIFDNYNSLRKEEENEYLSWKRLETFLNKLKTKRVASVVIHHTNKEGKEQSGSQRKQDYVDLCIRIQKSILSTKEKGYVEVEMQKFRWGKEADIILTELVFQDGEIDLVRVDYEYLLEQSILRDFGEYGERYVRQKYQFLGYKLIEYAQKIGVGASEDNEGRFF